MTVMDARNDACGVMLEPARRGMPRRVRLAQFTTLGVGGEAELWVCHNLEELLEATRAPYRVLGGGSNLIVSDDGVPERVIKLGGDYSRTDLERDPDLSSNTVCVTGWVGAAKPIPALIRALQKRGLSGLEGLVGVPAAVGGAVRMNAGTRYGEMADALQAVEVVTDGEVRVFDPEELGFVYRNSRLPQGQNGVGIVTRVKLKLSLSTPEVVQQRMNLADDARKGQPHWRTFGCAWKNPAHDSAGRLVDRAGLKGTRVGGAMVSLEHGNFIINTGGASAQDVLQLMRIIEEKLGVPLEREVEIWATDPEATLSIPEAIQSTRKAGGGV
jgi:UDP-N-acetylmuramate dehydrogenase